MTGGNGEGLIDRLIPDNDPCPHCGYRARVIRQTAELPTNLVGRVLAQNQNAIAVEKRARMREVWCLCFNCLRRERWGWKNGEWTMLEAMIPALVPHDP